MEKVVRIYTSFKEEEKAHYKRLSLMNIKERLDEFGVIQERTWGKLWSNSPIVKKIVIDKIG